MHPVWMVEVTGSSAGVASVLMPGAGSITAATKRLRVNLRAPQSVPVGGAMKVLVRVESGANRTRGPKPEANLFFEVRT
jgi:hypothetical protein